MKDKKEVSHLQKNSEDKRGQNPSGKIQDTSNSNISIQTVKTNSDIQILLYNISLEHSAIVQYLYHIFTIDDANITSEIEEIARQEMRHMKWFAEKVLELGGKLKISRVEEEIKPNFPYIRNMLKSDVEAEELAIKTYISQIEKVKSDDVKILLERVVQDEMAHREQFSQLLISVPEDKKIKISEAEGEGEGTILDFLNEEYKSIIEYLHAFFLAKNPELKNILFDIAVESMVHLGWIGEKLGEVGFLPKLRRYETEAHIPELHQKIRQKIDFEKRAIEIYKKGVDKIKSDDIKKLAERIVKQEEYHVYRLEKFLGKIHKLALGSLKKRK